MRVSNNYFRGTRIAINKGSYYDITFKDDKLVFTDVFETEEPFEYPIGDNELLDMLKHESEPLYKDGYVLSVYRGNKVSACFIENDGILIQLEKKPKG